MRKSPVVDGSESWIPEDPRSGGDVEGDVADAAVDPVGAEFDAGTGEGNADRIVQRASAIASQDLYGFVKYVLSFVVICSTSENGELFACIRYTYASCLQSCRQPPG